MAVNNQEEKREEGGKKANHKMSKPKCLFCAQIISKLVVAFTQVVLVPLVQTTLPVKPASYCLNVNGVASFNPIKC